MEAETCEEHYRLGCDLRKRKCYANAILHLRAAIELDSLHAEAHAELGAALMGLAEKSKDVLPDAQRAFETALQLNPDDGWSGLYLTNIFQRMGETTAANKQFKAILKRWPNFGLAHIHYGRFADEELNDYLNAKSHLKRAVELDPNDELALFSLGNFLCKHNRRKEGERYLKRAAALDHAQAIKLLSRLSEYVPKLRRWQNCAECGSLLGARETWWCSECGADLRIKQFQIAHEFHFNNRNTRLTLPR